MSRNVTQLAVHRHVPLRHELKTQALPDARDSEVVVRVEFFGLSANNVTYAALGKQLRYFEFFPIDEDWSALPVWGVGSVIESKAESVPIGTRLFGYFPAASHAILRVGAITPTGLQCARDFLPREFGAYNQYGVAGRDPFYLDEREPLMVVTRPLFLTGLLLTDYLTVKDRLGAEVLLISSAASKTAYGLAAALHAAGAATVLGLASSGGQRVADTFGIYERILPYEALETLNPSQSVLYVDISGSQPLRTRLAAHLGDALRGVLSVGLTHWKEGVFGATNEGPRVETFFAPGWAAQRTKELGAAFGQSMVRGFRAQLEGAQRHFVVTHEAGAAPLLASFAALADGQLQPAEALVRSL